MKTVESKKDKSVVNLHKTNQSYYSIVPVDEIFVCSDSVPKQQCTILEKELEEQDELLKSFQSIKSKENNKTTTKKIKKPTSLPFLSSHLTKKQKRGCDFTSREQFKKNNKRTVDSKQQDKIYHNCRKTELKNGINGKVNCEACGPPCVQCENKEKIIKEVEEREQEESEVRKNSKVNFTLQFSDEKFINTFVDYTVEDEEFMCSPIEVVDSVLECCKRRETTEDLPYFSCSPEMDASGGGPDSGLDTSSTGCVPAGGFSSPREHTVSETSGVDLTEAAIGEDMPHDGDDGGLVARPVKLSASSSVSSEAGTWDSTFPHSNSDNGQEQNTEDKTNTDSVKTLPANKKQESECFLEERSKDCEAEHEKCEHGFSVQVSAPVQERSCISQHTNNGDNVLPLHVTSITNISLQTKSEENLENSGELLKTEISGSGLVNEKQSDFCDKYSEINDNHEAEKIEEREIKEETNKNAPEDEVSDTEGKLKDEFGANYVETKFVPGLYSSYNERCNDWWLEPSPHSSLGSQNYFIDAASLVDDSEVSLPPFQVSKSDQVLNDTKECEVPILEAVTATPHTSPVSERSKLSCITASDIGSVNSPAVPVSQDLSSVKAEEKNLLDYDFTIVQSHKEAVDKSSEHLKDAPELVQPKYTHLKPSAMRLDGQDHYAEFEKELKLSESLAPQTTLQKLHREGMRRRWDSCSEEMLGGSSRQFDTADGLAEVCKSDLNIIHTVSVEDHKGKDNEHEHATCSSPQILVKLDRESLVKDSSYDKSFSNIEPVTKTPVDLESEFDRQKRCSHIYWHGDNLKQEVQETTDKKIDNFADNVKVPQNHNLNHRDNGTEFEQLDSNAVTMTMGDKSNSPTEAEPRPSLIRRNTFELDTDDEHLALLRQEYERRQGNLVFQSHIPQFSGHITGNEGFRDAQSLIMVGSDLTAEGIMTEYMQASHISAPSSLLFESSKLITNIDNTLNVPVPAAISNASVVTGESYFVNPSTHIHSGEVKELDEMRELTFTDTIKIEPYSEVPVVEFGVSEDLMPRYTNDYNKCSESVPSQDQELLNSDGLSTDLDALSQTDKDTQKYAVINYDTNSKPVVSGALTFSDIIEDKKSWDSPKKQKRTESTPIISGGVSTIDFSVKPRKVNDSPVLSRRRNELAPILSGAAPVLPETNVDKTDTQPPKNVSAKSAWVVDMSDCAVTVAKKPPLDSRRRRKSDITMTPSKTLTEAVEQNQCVESKEETNGFVLELKESVSQGHGLNLKSSEVLPKENKIQKSASASSVKSCGLGYFVDLSEPKSERKVSNSTEGKARSLKSNAQEGKSCGYFVGLGKDEFTQKKEGHSIVKQHSADEIKDVSSEKKNLMFSMFIDISAPKQETHPDMNGTDRKDLSPSSLKRKTSQSIKAEDASKSGKQNRIAGTTFDVGDEKQQSAKGTYMYIDASLPSSVTEHPAPAIDKTVKEMPEKKQAVFMFIESDSPVTRRKTLPSGLRPNFNRHSWNPETEERAVSRKQHKRAHSLSVDRSSLSTSCEEKSSSASSLSKSRLQSSSQSLSEDSHVVKQMSSSCHGRLMSKTYEKFVKRSLSSEGNSESEINTITEEKNYSEKMQEKSSEALFVALEEADTKDVDSLVATDMLSQKKVSSVVDNTVYRQHLTAKGESENTVREKNVSSSSRASDVECSSGGGDKRLPEKLLDQGRFLQTGKQRELGSEATNRSFTVESTNDVNAAKVGFLESEAKSAGSGSFVKLSDLDREPETKPDSCSVDSLPSFSSTGRMTRSIPETSWIENKLLMTRSIGSGTTSKSLGRLFPHLHSTAASSSSPKTGHSKSPSGQLEVEDNETQVSETSDLSSMQSSMGPSGLEGSTEETDASSSCAGRSAPVSRLGEDLLRMFLEEINPDVTVEVGGRRMKAHKCILSSRCQYFAAMLSGGWVESAGNVISLQGFSYNAVHFALCHIYSGASNIPDSISIVELATLADMLGLEGLKEVIMYTLKVKYCHFFHKPCSMCAVGVLECLPLAAAYGLDEIYRKSLKWITKHFVKIWPTKGFTTLPRELIDKCFQQHVVHMTADNVLETVTSCDKLLAIIPNVRWAEPVFSLTSQLLEACIKFVAHHFSGVLSSDSFLSLAKDSNWNISQLEDSLMAATDRLPPDQACQSYAHLHHILNAAKSSESQPEVPWSSSFLELLERLQKRVEVSLVRQAPRAARSPSWLLMEPELQRRIQEAACLVLVPSDETHRSRHISLSARHSSTSSSGSRSLDLRQVKLAMTQQARRTASGGRVSTLRADISNISRRQQQQQQQQQQQSVQQSHQMRQHPATAVAHPPKNGEVKTQESKQKLPKQKNQSASCAATPEKHTTTTRRPGRTISSSDSSRTSSPAMRRSAPGSDSSGKSRTFPTGSVPRGVSGTSPGRDAKGRRKKDGEFSMSTDSLSELMTNSAKVQLKETNDVTKSKSRCSVPVETILVKKRVGDEITISTDSLSESAAVPERLKGQEATSQSAPNATRPDTPKERRHALGRIGTDVTMSTDSLATAESFVVDNVPSKTQTGKTVTSTSHNGSSKHDVNRTPTAKGVKGGPTRMENQQSPLPAIRKLTNRQTVLSPRDSPTARLRSGATSSPYSSSPSLRRNVLISARPTPDNVSSINNNSKNVAPTKAVVQLKSERVSIKANSSSSTAAASTNRRTPPRLQGKNQLSSPAKVSSENKTSSTRSALREAGGTFTLSKTVINVNKVNNNALKKTVNGVLSRNKCVTEAVAQTKTKVETKKGGPREDKPPSVGSRSGTFLKDEPTILKKPDVDNVQE